MNALKSVLIFQTGEVMTMKVCVVASVHVGLLPPGDHPEAVNPKVNCARESDEV